MAGLKITAKAVEREAEEIGADIAAREKRVIQQAKQLQLPAVCTPSVPVLYVEMDGTAIPVMKAETEGRAGKIAGQSAHTREVETGLCFYPDHNRQGGSAYTRRGLYNLCECDRNRR